MPNPNAVLTVNFNMKLDSDTDEKLIALAVDRHQPKSATVRDLIRAAYQMTAKLIPTCANGTACRCPHAHVYSPPLAPPPTLPAAANPALRPNATDPPTKG